jgi:hypothetical protein
VGVRCRNGEWTTDLERYLVSKDRTKAGREVGDIFCSGQQQYRPSFVVGVAVLEGRLQLLQHRYERRIYEEHQ